MKTSSLLEQFRAAMAADEDAALRCPVCGAVGFAPCDTTRHLANVASFAAWNSRTQRLWAYRDARVSP
jgi:hypothetical protein